MVDVHSWHSCDMNTQKALVGSANICITTVYLRPSFLKENGPEKLYSACITDTIAESWCLTRAKHGDMIVD